jgi:enoyl-CoA hydratase
MNFRHLKVTRDGHVLTCTLSNPPHHTLTAGGVIELFELLNDVESDSSIRVLVFTGAGEDVFIAHYEVGELSETALNNIEGEEKTADQDSSKPELSGMHQLCLRLERMSAITIAAINGSTTGGGFEFSLACDFRLLADGRYRVGLPETSIGIIPGAGGTQRYARLLGTARALDLILHAKLLTPAEALELGLVHRLFPPTRFREETRAFAVDIASRAPIALTAAKEAIQQGSRLPLDEALLLEQRCFDRTMRSKDTAGAMQAFLSGAGKTPYVWQGE